MTSLSKDLGRKPTSMPGKISPPKASEWQKSMRYIRENAILFLIGAPAIILILLFSYIPKVRHVLGKPMFLY